MAGDLRPRLVVGDRTRTSCLPVIGANRYDCGHTGVADARRGAIWEMSSYCAIKQLKWKLGLSDADFAREG